MSADTRRCAPSSGVSSHNTPWTVDGTVQSVPRLMPGQGVIVGVGSIDYPAEFEGADRANLSSLGISKVVTITSTYDHRIIQGAESGMFLKRVHELLLGEHGFYDDVFAALDMPYQAVRWRPDVNPIDREEAMLQKQMQVATLIRVYRVRGHLIADLDPLRWKEPALPKELDPLTYGLTIWDLEREFLTGGVAGKDRMALGDLLGVEPEGGGRPVVELAGVAANRVVAVAAHLVDDLGDGLGDLRVDELVSGEAGGALERSGRGVGHAGPPGAGSGDGPSLPIRRGCGQTHTVQDFGVLLHSSRNPGRAPCR